MPHNCKDPKSINFPPPLLCLDYNTTAHLLAYKVCSVIFFASLLLYQDGLITLPNNKSFQHHFYLSIKANDATITGFICHIKISMKEIKVRVLPPLTEFSVAWICLVSSEMTYLYVHIYRSFFDFDLHKANFVLCGFSAAPLTRITQGWLYLYN